MSRKIFTLIKNTVRNLVKRRTVLGVGLPCISLYCIWVMQVWWGAKPEHYCVNGGVGNKQNFLASITANTCFIYYTLSTFSLLSITLL